MAEQFSNNAQTTLNGAITNVASTLIVTSATGFPTSGNFRILIKAEGANTDEICTVTAVSGTTFTISRASEATAGVQSASAHGSGATIAHVLTAASVRAWIDSGDSGVSGGSTSLPNDFTNYTDLASISLAAGTWFVQGEVSSQKASGTVALTVRTWDGTNKGGECDHGSNGLPPGDHDHSIGGLHVLSGTTTVKLQAKANATGFTMLRAHIYAIKVA